VSFEIRQAVNSWKVSLEAEKNPLKKVALKVAIFEGYLTELDRVIRLQILEAVRGKPYGTYTAGRKNTRKLLSSLEVTMLGEGYPDMDPQWFVHTNTGMAKHLDLQARKVLKWEDEGVRDDAIMYLITGSTSDAPLEYQAENGEWIALDPILEREPAAYRLGRTNTAQILSGSQSVKDITNILGARVSAKAKSFWVKVMDLEKKMEREHEQLQGEAPTGFKGIDREESYSDFRFKTKYTGQGDFAWALMEDPRNPLGKALKAAFTEAFMNNARFYELKSGEIHNFALAGWFWWQELRKKGTALIKGRKDQSIVKKVQERMMEAGIPTSIANLTRGNNGASVDLAPSQIPAQAGLIWKALALAGIYVKNKYPKLMDRLDNMWSLYTGPMLGAKLASQQVVKTFMTNAQPMIKSATLRWDDPYVRIGGKKIPTKNAMVYMNGILQDNCLAVKVSSNKDGWVLKPQDNGLPIFHFGNVSIHSKD